ncbi:hypothetical protein ED236_10870 [Pseudomethylobacillus aquaticus]|uniref:Nickel transporter n=1 Tax=Pseudomethylobacillus aquaticus TaxID=2676064 RepID=A0A3N0UXS2_9PROT|nr:HisA/HisF-related TIM barrel protein [Pseudomethylobacillus aquaticus]ROH85346.1 hypothetical protein ED236_10870 [Pseudomethylobacillus aquaticus]
MASVRRQFEVIPVIDLRDGEVVHARRGQRQRYQAMRSELCTGSDALQIIDHLLRLYPFPRLYIADLDAIQQRGHQRALVETIRAQFPALELWVDAGIRCASDWQAWQLAGVRCVAGSENLESLKSWQALQTSLPQQAVLSLDFVADEVPDKSADELADAISATRFCGPPELQQPAHWPQQLIAMTLARVGSSAGPDLALLDQLQKQAPQQQLYAAGGVRNLHDLQRLQAQGLAGALVASALHDGSLSTQALQQLLNTDRRPD